MRRRFAGISLVLFAVMLMGVPQMAYAAAEPGSPQVLDAQSEFVLDWHKGASFGGEQAVALGASQLMSNDGAWLGESEAKPVDGLLNSSGADAQIGSSGAGTSTSASKADASIGKSEADKANYSGSVAFASEVGGSSSAGVAFQSAFPKWLTTLGFTLVSVAAVIGLYHLQTAVSPRDGRRVRSR